jgi:hypothetical protein
MKMNDGVLIAFLATESAGLTFNGITLFYIVSNFDVGTHVFTLILIGSACHAIGCNSLHQTVTDCN